MLKLAELTPDPDLLGGFDIRQAIGLSAARLLLRGKGTPPRPPCVETLRRWIISGCPCGRGEPLKLQARRVNGEYLTMSKWVEEFERERVRRGSVDPLADEPTNRAREAQKRAAARVLDRAGIGHPKG